MSIEDIARREAIAQYEVVGRPPEPDLEGLVELAASLCTVPRAVINIIDDRSQHQIASFGFEADVCSREDSMCAKVFRHPGHTVVHDAREDSRFRDNPFVTGEVASVRFYASSPLVTPEGIPIGTLCVFDEEVGDLSEVESHRLALLAHQVVDVLELRRITRELGRSNESLSQFAGQVSHDLRNPLSALAGFLEIAADSPELVDAPNAARALARAEAATARMSALVEDLLDYARIGGSHTPRPVALDPIVAEVVDDLSSQVAATRASIAVEPLPVVQGDATLLRALLQNLLSNALRFASAGGRAPRVAVRAEELEGGWRVRVDDDGPGVPEDERERVFGLLERGDERADEGLGIGLSTCRRIVQSLGGRIGIEDSPLGGASVWFVLPE